MPDFCTCGAELPPDARFCHRCGKPQREEVIPETVERRAEIAVAAAPVQPSRAPLPGVSFHNPMAVRIGLLMASAASLSSPLPVWLAGLAGLVVWWLFAGFLSVYLYRRQTGQFLTVDSGLRMGWITGLLGSTMTAVLFTISMVPLARSGGVASMYEERFRKLSATDPNVQQALKVLESPSGVAILIVIALLLVFAIVTFFCTAGGALGAKFGGRQ
jgi:hypothetical protein